MKTYRCSAEIVAHLEVEAESLVEAQRIIDGVLQNASSVRIFEGDEEDPEDSISGCTGTIGRSKISAEQ
jgi:hypothetical protein